MNIFINGATKEKSIILFDNATVLDCIVWNESGKESEHVLPGIIKILENNHISFSDIESMVIVHGPGAFTGLRVVVSVVNTIGFVHTHIELRAVSVGELFSVIDTNKHNKYVFQIYPADMFVFENSGKFLERVPESDMQNFVNAEMAGEVLTDFIPVTQLSGATEWTAMQMHAVLQKATPTIGILVPFYAKEPNITTRKQS